MSKNYTFLILQHSNQSKNNFVFIAKGKERVLEYIYEPFDVKDFDDSIKLAIWKKEMGNTAVDKYIRGDITKGEFEQLLEYKPDDSKTNILDWMNHGGKGILFSKTYVEGFPYQLSELTYEAFTNCINNNEKKFIKK